MTPCHASPSLVCRAEMHTRDVSRVGKELDATTLEGSRSATTVSKRATWKRNVLIPRCVELWPLDTY